MQITRTGFGARAIGAFGWSKQDDVNSIAAIRQALERGTNWVDTAAVCGLGRSEEVVAQRRTAPSGRQPHAT
jgi:aryl-alcohol dehydrogenase-like predicted oxidoreductase